MSIEAFVKKLSSFTVADDAKNPWDLSREGNAIRRKNLTSYLKKMREHAPAVLLVGEAPGYRGSGRTGSPFSSEKILLTHSFFSDRSLFDIENREEPMGEASASIVWKTFDTLGFYPLMWAAYPFHPHVPGNPSSNRAPRKEEVLAGKEFLQEILTLYPVEHIVAVGRVAEKTLGEMGYEARSIRHPSHGGATLFAKGLEDIARTIKR